MTHRRQASQGRVLFVIATIAAITALATAGCMRLQTSDRATIWHDVRETPAAGQESVTGYFQEFGLDTPQSGPAIVATDEQDNVWVALAKSGRIAKYANGMVTLFDVGKDSRPVGLAVGTRANGYPGEIWIAASYDNKIVRFDERVGVRKEYKIPGDASWPFNIAIDPSGKIWFTERTGGHVGRLDPVTGAITRHAVPTPNAGPAGLAIDAVRNKVWFTESYADGVGVLDMVTGAFEEYQMSTTSTGLINGPAGLALDSAGGVWFAKLEGKLGHIPPGARHIELIDTPAEARRPAGITVSPAGDIWTLALDGNLLLRYVPHARRFYQYPLPVGAPDKAPDKPPTAKTSRPFGLAFDTQGNVWFSQQYTGQLGVLDLAPPTISLLSPEGIVRIPFPLLSMRAVDRVAGVRNIVVRIDGADAGQAQGRLILRHLHPGDHILEVEASDGDGRVARVQKHFRYEPSAAALASLVGSLKLKNSDAGAFKEQLSMLARDERTPNRFGDMLHLLDRHRNELHADDHDMLRAVVGWVAEHEGENKVVRVSAEPPYFEPREVTVKKGGSVTWLYGDDGGHGGNHVLQQIRIPSLGEQSAMLRGGDQYTVQFQTTGRFSIENSKKADAVGAVNVTQ